MIVLSMLPMQCNPENEGRTIMIPHCLFLQTAIWVADCFLILILSVYFNIQSHIRFKSSSELSSMLFLYSSFYQGSTMVTANIKGFSSPWDCYCVTPELSQDLLMTIWERGLREDYVYINGTAFHNFNIWTMLPLQKYTLLFLSSY